MKSYPLFVLLVLCAGTFANFTYLYSINGSNQDDGSDYYLFSQPTGLLFVDGKLYVADSGKNALYIMNGTQRLRAVVYSANVNPLTNPLRMAYDNGTVYIADGISGRIKTYSNVGSDIKEWNSGSSLLKASGLALDAQNAYITDVQAGRLMVYSREKKAYSRMGLDAGGSDGLLSAPQDVEIYGDSFFISDSGKGLVYVYDLNLTYQYAIGRGKGGVTLLSPRGIEVYRDRVYVADSSSSRVVAFTLDGYPVEVLSGNLSYPEDVAVDGNTLYVADMVNRLVRAYDIGAEAGNGTVMNQIKDAQNAVSALRSLQATSVKLGLKPGTDDYSSLLESARQDHDNYLFSSASATALSVSSRAASDMAALAQQVSVKVKQVTKEASDTTAPYRGKAKGEIAQQLSSIDNTIADALAKLSAGKYGEAADAVMPLPAKAKEFAAAAEKQGAEAQKEQQAKEAATYVASLNLLEVRIGHVEAKAADYHQDVNLSNARRLLEIASGALAGGDVALANRTMGLVETEVALYEASVSQAANDADAALANVTAYELALNASAARPMLVPADLAPERAAISQARQTAYLNPQLAQTMAVQAAQNAETKVKDAQTLSTAVAALLVMSGLVLALGIGFFIHLRGRKRKEKAEAERKKARQAKK